MTVEIEGLEEKQGASRSEDEDEDSEDDSE